MYKQAEKDDARVRVFCETGTMFVPKEGIVMRLFNNQTRVCIVAHKALAQFEDMPDELKEQETFVMIYKFKGMNGNVGITLIQSCITDNYQILFHNDYKEANKHFVKLMQTAAKTTDRNIIYVGSRNEG